MKHIHVTCAIIEKDGLVLAAQRSASMSMPLKWEFPGGKIDPGETARACLTRELLEELGIYISIEKECATSTYDYPQFRITLYPFICTIKSGEIVLHEHAKVQWVKPDDLNTFDWAEADIPVLQSYLGTLRNFYSN